MLADLLPTVLFYLFSAVLLGAALMVISVRNPVHAVLFLILAFFNAAALFLLIGAEYLAMTLIIVYVGAVAVLFLFVVMMLDVNFAALREGFLRYLPLGGTVAAIILAELLLVMYRSAAALPPPEAQAEEALAPVSNTHALGGVLYTDYIYAFQLAGLILLIAMVGAIVLTLRHRPGVRRQNAARQIARKRDDAVAVVKVETGRGV